MHKCAPRGRHTPGGVPLLQKQFWGIDLPVMVSSFEAFAKIAFQNHQ